jgi:predicted metal-binding protein
MNFLNTTRSSYVLDASIAIIFFGENEYCSGRRIGPTLNSIKKTNTKEKLKFYSCFKNDVCFIPWFHVGYYDESSILSETYWAQ